MEPLVSSAPRLTFHSSPPRRVTTSSPSACAYGASVYSRTSEMPPSSSICWHSAAAPATSPAPQPHETPSSAARSSAPPLT